MSAAATGPGGAAGPVVRHNLRVRDLLRMPGTDRGADVVVVDGEWPRAFAWPGWLEPCAGPEPPACPGPERGWRVSTGPRKQDWRLWLRRAHLTRADDGLAGVAEVLAAWERRRFSLALPQGTLELSAADPCVMGILNVTPDSFSDGGRLPDAASAIERGLALVEAGAGVLDVGGESTRPGSAAVDAAEELRRVLPVVRGLVSRVTVPLSVDTRRAAVAGPVLEAGAALINDTSAGRDDPDLLPLVARHGAGLVLMHRQGVPRTMQEAPRYEHCRAEVAAFLRAAVARAVAAGVTEDRLVVDPGLGFGKRQEDNEALLSRLRELRSLGLPVLLGASRKRFLGRITGREVGEREAATLATTAVALREGASLVRVHEVRASRDLLRVLAVSSDG